MLLLVANALAAVPTTSTPAQRKAAVIQIKGEIDDTTHDALVKRFGAARAAGASVVIQTTDAATRDAIHAFLRYQIVEHKTGDPLTVR
jgi:membrane-bound ClpP family serine protease